MLFIIEIRIKGGNSMYQRIFCTIIIGILMFTISGYGEAKAKDELVVAQPLVQKMTPLKIEKIQYTHNHSKVFIPQISGMVNMELQATINNNLKEVLLSLTNQAPNSSLHGDTEVSFYNDNLLGLHFKGDSFTQGMPYPNKIDCGIHIDLRTGKVYKLADLFKTDVNFVERIHELCKQNDARYRMNIEGLWDGWMNTTFSSSWTQEEGAFLLLDQSIRVYSIPSNAMGAISGYNVPYADVMDIIDTDGKLWKQLKSEPSPVASSTLQANLATYNERLTLSSALQGVENINDWLKSFQALTNLTANRMTHEEKLQVGNLGADMQTIGFYNWVKSVEGTLYRQNYDISRLEYELALERLAAGKASQAEVTEKEKKYQEARSDIQKFLTKFHIAD